MYNVFSRQTNEDTKEDSKELNSARRMIVQVVNSLSAKMELGAPMAALYVLGNPDHYTTHAFVPFYWKNFVNYVERQWDDLEGRMECIDEGGDDLDTNVDSFKSENVDMEVHGKVEPNIGAANTADGDSAVVISRSAGHFVGRSAVDDYIMRPKQHEAVCLYEWIQCAVRHQKTQGSAALRFFSYAAGHPMASTHRVACDPERRHTIVPNFIGPPLPRADKEEDRDRYSCAMLTLFKPWRSGLDLKAHDATWENTFTGHTFTERQEGIMRNFNVRHECYDARDDFWAENKREAEGDEDALEGDGGDDVPNKEDLGDGEGEDAEYWEQKMELDQRGKQREVMYREAEQALQRAGVHNGAAIQSTTAANTMIALKHTMDGSYWNEVIQSEKKRLWKDKFSHYVGRDSEDMDVDGDLSGVRSSNSVFVVPASYFKRSFIPLNPKWNIEMEDITKEHTLNTEQERAFRIVANHATCIEEEQLLMYLGGMAGTGKTQVLKALIHFFRSRSEPYRLVLLGPTGTSAALIGGTTYHSFLSLVSGPWGSQKAELQAIEEVRERLA
ncbi:hypothetical protein BKA70DRAFT_1049024, partial [Coprinopsis sp. MPI-PUGE-AT-0042]